MKNSVWKTFMELSLVRGIVPRTVFGLTAIAAIILIIGLALSKSKKRGRLHPLIVSLIAAVLAGAAGLLVAWLVSDVFMVFGVSLGWPVIFTIAGGIAGVGIAHRGDEIIRTDDGDAAGAVCRNELFGKLRRLLGRRFQQGRHVGHHIAGHRIGDGAHRIDRGDVEAFLLGKS